MREPRILLRTPASSVGDCRDCSVIRWAAFLSGYPAAARCWRASTWSSWTNRSTLMGSLFARRSLRSSADRTVWNDRPFALTVPRHQAVLGGVRHGAVLDRVVVEAASALRGSDLEHGPGIAGRLCRLRWRRRPGSGNPSRPSCRCGFSARPEAERSTVNQR